MSPQKSWEDLITFDTHAFSERFCNLTGIFEPRALRQLEAHLIAQARQRRGCVPVVGLTSHSRSRQPFEHCRITTAITNAIDFARPHRADGSVDFILRTGLPGYRAVVLSGVEYFRRYVLRHTT